MPDFSGVESGASSAQSDLARAMFQPQAIPAQPVNTGFFHDVEPDGPAEAGKPYGFPDGQQTPAQARGVRVALGAESPRLTERIAPESEGLAGTLGDMAQDVENVVRGIPSGGITGTGTFAADALGGTAFLPQNLPGTLAKLALHQPVPELAGRDAARALTEGVAAPVRAFFQPEGTAGVVGEQVGALAVPGAALKGLAGLRALKAERDAARALESETLERMTYAPEDAMVTRQLRRDAVAGRAQAADAANAAAGKGMGRLAQTEARMPAIIQRNANARAAERQAAVEAYLREHPPTVGEDAGIRRGKPLVTPPPQERKLLTAGEPVRPSRPSAFGESRLDKLRTIMGERRAPVESPVSAPKASAPVRESELASLSEPGVATIRPTVIRGRRVFMGGAPRFRMTEDDALLARRRELLDRLDQAQEDIGKGTFEYVREDANSSGTERPVVWVGRKVTNEAGRAMGALKRDADLIAELDAELKGRGWNYEAIDRHMPASEASRLRSMREAARLDQVEANMRTRESLRQTARAEGEARAERYGIASEAEPVGAGATDFDPSQFLGDERGAVSLHAASTLGGAATGAAVGYASGDDKGRVGRALTGAIAGGIAGSMLARAAATRGTVNTRQLAMQDADVAAVLNEGAPRPSARAAVTGLSAKMGAAVRSGWQKLVDDVYAAREFGRRVGKSEAVSEEASRAKGWRGFGDALVGTRPTEATLPHPTLRAAVEAAKGREADVTALLRAERAIELDDAGKGWYITADRPTTEAAVRKLSAIPEVRQAADRLRAFYDHLLELRWKNGLLSDEEYLAIRQAHQQYVPFVPASDAERVLGGSVGGKLFNRTKGVRQLTEGAGGYAKVDPFQQAVEDAYRTARDVSKQRVMQAVSEIVETNPQAAAPYMREVTGDAIAAARRRGEGKVVDAIVNGKRRTYEILDENFADALGHVGPTSRSILVRLLSVPARALRAGVTIVPGFGVANAERDAFFTASNFPVSRRAALGGAAVGAATGALANPEDRVKGALIGGGLGLGAGIMGQHAVRIGQGLGEVLGNTGLYQEWLREGGAGTGYFVSSQKDAARLIRQMRQTGEWRDVVNPRSWWEAVEYLNQAVEQAPRVAKYASERAKGALPRTAAAASRDVSVDFARGGSDTKGLRSTSAFWNPNLQGKARLLTAFKSPKAWATGVAAMTAPTVALWAINKNDPSYWKRPLWERNTFWLIPIGKEETGDTRFLKLMKPFEVGFVFASVPERMLDLAYQRDPERTAAAVKDMMGQVGQGAIPLPTAALPVGEALIGERGYDTFRNRDIVTSDVQNLPSREQYNLDTPGPAIGVSRAVELATGGLVQPSPQKVEHVIRGYTGTLGGRALAAGDRFGKAIGLDDRAPSAREESGQFDRFVTRPNDFGTDDVRAMFRQFDAGEAHYRKLQDLVDAKQVDAARAYAQQHRDALAEYVRLKPVVKTFREISQARRQIEQAPNLTAEQKQQAIQRLGTLASRIAASGTGSRAPGRVPEPATMEATR